MTNNNDLIHLYHSAIDISKAAGDFIKRNASKSLKIDYKGRANMVTQIDKQSEQLIRESISEKYPEHQILGEESADKATDSRVKWIVDPVDGTTNFIHNHHMVAVSIGIAIDEEMLIGVVNCPFLNEIFTAMKDQGAYLNGRKIHVSNVDKMENGLFGTGFPYELNDHFYKNMEIFKKIYESSQGVRRGGSAAIDLCYTACGRFDGFWEFELNPWDIAAGSLLIQEAGGQICNFSGQDFDLYDGQVLATNNKLQKPMLEMINEIL
ncbi:MAG TPA: inositol monophosphatase family protein [bacterium]|nr:inositol monophosphatase family protein [bacterium]